MEKKDKRVNQDIGDILFICFIASVFVLVVFSLGIMTGFKLGG